MHTFLSHVQTPFEETDIYVMQVVLLHHLLPHKLLPRFMLQYHAQVCLLSAGGLHPTGQDRGLHGLALVSNHGAVGCQQMT